MHIQCANGFKLYLLVDCVELRTINDFEAICENFDQVYDTRGLQMEYAFPVRAK